ncbi:MAG: MGMT family protein [Chloroflexota bacterium]
MKKRKSPREKLEQEQERRLVDTDKGRMLVPKPLDVDAVMRRIGEGKLVTVTQVRERLAREYGADFTCPLTTGIFMRIAAEAAEEDLEAGRTPVTPYWRVVGTDGRLNEKFPGGAELQAARLKEEGHRVLVGRGKSSLRVGDFESCLQELWSGPLLLYGCYFQAGDRPPRR